MDYLTTHTSLSPIHHGFAPGFVNYKKGCTRLAAACDKVYQLLADGQWFSPGTPVSSTTKTGHHDIAEILLKVALNHQNQSINQSIMKIKHLYIIWWIFSPIIKYYNLYLIVDTYQIGCSPCACMTCHFAAKAVFVGEYLTSLNEESGLTLVMSGTPSKLLGLAEKYFYQY